MNTPHTPGPCMKANAALIAAAMRYAVTQQQADSCMKANAALIAAAPKLLAALEVLVERIEYYSALPQDQRPCIEQWEYTEGSGDMAIARAAIAKARGQA